MTQDKHKYGKPEHEAKPSANQETVTPDSGNAPDGSPGAQARRRRLLQAVTAAGIGGAATLPTHWSRPVVDSVLLPAHAQATPAVGQAACAITCTNAVTEAVAFVRFDVVLVARTLVEQCVSEDGQVSSTSSFVFTDQIVPFVDYTASTGTFSTYFTLSALTNTVNIQTTFSTSSQQTFQRAC